MFTAILLTVALAAVLSPQVDRLVDENEAADILGIKPQTLAVWRGSGRYDLPFCKIGRAVRYKMSDLQAFIESRRVTSTGEADAL